MALPGWAALGLLEGGKMLLGSLFNSGNDRMNKQALRTQMDIAKALLQMTQGNYAVDLPYKTDLYTALRNRLSSKYPSYKAKDMVVNNPLRAVKSVNTAKDAAGNWQMQPAAALQLLQGNASRVRASGG